MKQQDDNRLQKYYTSHCMTLGYLHGSEVGSCILSLTHFDAEMSF